MLEDKRKPENSIEEQARQRSANRSKKQNKKETIQVVTKDLIRNLV